MCLLLTNINTVSLQQISYLGHSLYMSLADISIFPWLSQSWLRTSSSDTWQTCAAT